MKFIEIADECGKALLLEEHIAQVGFDDETKKPIVGMKDGSIYFIAESSLHQLMTYFKEVHEVTYCSLEGVPVGGWR